MLECCVIGPGASNHPDKAVRIFVDQIRIAADFAPSVFDRGQIFAATGSDFAAALISEVASLRRLMAKREPRQP
jgi:hypothetical protein